MSKIIDKLNTLLAPADVTAEFVPACDESVDDEIALYVEAHAQSVAGVQLCGRYYAASCWTSTRFDEIEHGRMRRDIREAIIEALRLMRKYGWINV